VLLHCPTLSATRAEAWEGKNPGGVRVLLANPRWERRLLKLSGAGRVMDDGVDEDAARAEVRRIGCLGGGGEGGEGMG